MLSENTTQLLSILGCSNAEIAKLAGCNPSLISRIRNGRRKPPIDSSSITLLTDGICRFAEAHELTSALSDAIGTDEALRSWLLFGDPIPEAKAKALAHQAAFCAPLSSPRIIGEKIGAAMSIASVSNSKLARKLNVDSSYVSRLRSGTRSISSNSSLSQALADYLFSCIWKSSSRWKQLCSAMGIPDATCTMQQALERFSSWLFNQNEKIKRSSVQELLSSIENFRPSPTPAFQGSIEEPQPIYWGIEGMRKAVQRFLLEVIERKAPEIWLYSDEDMGWMTGDEAFFSRWKALMIECARNQTRIRIIHNIDRGVNEMFQAIGGWLPLYMLGAIEPWYCTKSSDSRFTHTMFIIPGAACITAFQARGMEAKGWHDYLTDRDQVASAASDFKALLKCSLPLVRISTSGSSQSDGNWTSDRYAFSSSLCLETMPTKLLARMLDKGGIDKAKQDAVLSLHQERSSALITNLGTFSFWEFVRIQSSEDPCCIDLDPLGIRQKLNYGPEDRSAHLEAVTALLEANGNYHFIPVSFPELSNITIEMDSKQAIVTRTDGLQISFAFSNPMMIQAFRNFFRIMAEEQRPQ